MKRFVVLAGIITPIALSACSPDEDTATVLANRNQDVLGFGSGFGSGMPDAGMPAPDAPMPPAPDAMPPPPPPPPPSCDGQSTTASPRPGVNAVICVTSGGPFDDLLGTYTATASFQIDGSYFGMPGWIAGTLSLDANLTTDDAGNGSFTVTYETSGSWTRDGMSMSAGEFESLWSQVAPGQTAPTPGGSILVNATVTIEAIAVAFNAAAAADPCQADANNLDAAANVYNLTVGGSILGAAAIGLLEVPTWGTATAGFIGLSTAVATAKINYNAACKNFQLCCKNNNWPAGVCRPKGAKRRGCKNDG
jgi:hypothetical protein